MYAWIVILAGPWRNAERWKWRTTGRMQNVIGRYAERAECQTGAMPNGPNAEN